MKRVLLILLIFVIFIYGCQTPTETAPQKKSLSDIQVTACNTAHEAGTCDTRLAELGIVLKEDCCQILEKCC